MWRADQHRRKRRLTTAQHIEILRTTQKSLIGRIDLNDQVDDRHATAITELEARLLDLEAQVRELTEQPRRADATTTSAAGAGTGASTAPGAAPGE